MTIEIIEGDLLEAFDRGDVNVIGHCCNAQGKMASGVAKSIRERYPLAYYKYMDYYQHGLEVGDIIDVNLELFGNRKVVFNLIGQKYYGRDGKKYLDDKGFKTCLQKMSENVSLLDTVGFPYLIGCNLAGGYWPDVLGWIEHYFKNHDVKIYRLNK